MNQFDYIPRVPLARFANARRGGTINRPGRRTAPEGGKTANQFNYIPRVFLARFANARQGGIINRTGRRKDCELVRLHSSRPPCTFCEREAGTTPVQVSDWLAWRRSLKNYMYDPESIANWLPSTYKVFIAEAFMSCSFLVNWMSTIGPMYITALVASRMLNANSVAIALPLQCSVEHRYDSLSWYRFIVWVTVLPRAVHWYHMHRFPFYSLIKLKSGILFSHSEDSI